MAVVGGLKEVIGSHYCRCGGGRKRNDDGLLMGVCRIL